MMIQSQHYTTPLEQSITTGLICSSSFHSQQVTGAAAPVVRDQKRPLSGYNVFFIMQRQRIISGESEDDHVVAMEEVNEFIENQRIVRNLPQPKRLHRKTHGKIGFREMARLLAELWKKLSPAEQQIYNTCAEAEKHRWAKEKERMNSMNNQCNVNCTQTHSDHDNEQPVFIPDDNSCCARNGQFGMQSSVVTPVPQMVQRTGLQATDQLECPPIGDEDNEDIDDEDDVDLWNEINESRRNIQNNLRLMQYQKAKLQRHFKQQQMQMFVSNQRRRLQFKKMNQQKQPQSLLSMMYPPTQSFDNNWIESTNQKMQQKIPVKYPSVFNNNWTTTVPELTPSNVMSSMNLSTLKETNNVANTINYSSWNLKTITDDNDDAISLDGNNNSNNYGMNNLLDVADETFDGVTDFLSSNDFFNNHFESDTVLNGCNNNNAHEDDDLLFEPIADYDLLGFQDDNYFSM